jgi:hypothetical protein
MKRKSRIAAILLAAPFRSVECDFASHQARLCQSQGSTRAVETGASRRVIGWMRAKPSST